MGGMGGIAGSMAGVPGSQQQSAGSLQQHVGLNPALDQANQSMMDQLGSAWGTPLDNGAQARQSAEDAIYGRETSRLDPQWNQREQQFNSGLTNQGIDPNSKAGQDALGNFGRDRNDAYEQAKYTSIIGGGQEASRQQQMDLQSRMAPLSGMGGLQGLSGMPPNPLLPAAMAQYQGALQNYAIQQAGKNSTMNGLTGTGGNIAAAKILAASDERAKEDIVRHPHVEQLPGVPLATFRYKGGRQRYRGVIAQDLDRAGYGHMVTEVRGVKMVDATDPRVAPVEVDDA